MRRFLITGVGGDVACAITRSLQDVFSQDEFFGMDIKPYTPYMERFAETAVAPRYTEKEYLPFLKDYMLKKEITHFLPTTEPEMLLADQERDFFKGNGIYLVLNNSEILRVCTSKYRTAEFLQSHGVEAPETFYASDISGKELRFPLVLKEDFGRGGHGMSVILDRVAWDQASKDRMVCQEYIEGPEYTVGVFSDGESVRSITYLRELGLGGMSVSVKCVDVPAIREIAEKTARAFQLEGSFNIQLREREGHFFVFEINPRLSSTTGFRHRMGFQDAVWWIEMLEGKRLSGTYEEPIGMLGIKVTDDVVFSGE